MSEISHRPFITNQSILEFAERFFDLKIKSERCIKELDSYEDRNFMVCGTFGAINGEECRTSEHSKSKRLVFKVMNARETYSQTCNIDAIDDAMIHVYNKLGELYNIPMPQKSIRRSFKELIELPVAIGSISKQLLEDRKAVKCVKPESNESKNLEEGENVIHLKYYVRLLSYVDGIPLSTVQVTDKQLFDCGKLVAKVSEALKDFSHPSLMKKNSMWDLENFAKLFDEEYLCKIDDYQMRNKIETFLKSFEEVVTPLKKKLPKQTLHSDISEQNIILSDGNREISGLIDFGDLIYSYRICEIANCMSHVGAFRKNELEDCGIILSGYLSEKAVMKEELDVLFYFVTARVVLCYLRGLAELAQDSNTGNGYVLKITNDAKISLDKFLERLHDQKQLVERWTALL